MPRAFARARRRPIVYCRGAKHLPLEKFPVRINNNIYNIVDDTHTHTHTHIFIYSLLLSI